MHPYGSPLSAIESIHLVRLVIIDGLPFQGYPHKRDTMPASQLLFTCDFDGTAVSDLARALTDHAPEATAEIWRHCVGFPANDTTGQPTPQALEEYLRRHQIEVTLYLADQPDTSVTEILRAIQVQRAFSEFLAEHQADNAGPLRDAFWTFWDRLDAKQPPHPGSG
jgi:hypothetical protein